MGIFVGPTTVARTGARATSAFVILAGAGLTALLVYALATELGSSVSDVSILDMPFNTDSIFHV
jgi:hypothetical protein